jgi:hypothetical protein
MGIPTSCSVNVSLRLSYMRTVEDFEHFPSSSFLLECRPPSTNLGKVHAIFNPEYHAFSCAIRKEDVISFAITDSALLHATLAHSALSLCNIARSRSSPDMAYHAGQAIRLVNKRIANSPQEAVSDATMFAVGCLTHFEVRLSPSSFLNSCDH